MKLSGVVLKTADRLNHGLKYSKEALKKAVAEYSKEKVEKGLAVGEFPMGETYDVQLENVSHQVKKISFDEDSGEVRADIEILDTPQGSILQHLLKANRAGTENLPLEFRLRSLSDKTEKHNDEITVQEAKIIAFDIEVKRGS